MNLLLFTSEEKKDNLVTVADRRAEHIIKILKLKEGDILRVGEVNGLIGRGCIAAVDNGEVRIEVELKDKPASFPPVELILALPRPIMLQRILKQATTLGVTRFHLVRSNKVEKSYFHSPVLQENKIREILLLGLEQAVDTTLPEVLIHKRFKPFVEDFLPGLAGIGLLAHPGAVKGMKVVWQEFADKRKRHNDNFLLAVGPEGGWSDYECAAFIGQGFQSFSLGERIMHVDTAVVSLLSSLSLLRRGGEGTF